jgi:hypothetical protein
MVTEIEMFESPDQTVRFLFESMSEERILLKKGGYTRRILR